MPTSSPSMSSSFSDAPVILESPTASTGYRKMPSKLSTPPAMQPTRRRLHRRRRREPQLDHHLTDRLDMLARYLQRASKIDFQEALHAQTQRAIDDLLDNIHSFFFLYEAEKRPLWRLAQTGRLVHEVESFHRNLDAITGRCGLAVAASNGSSSSLPRWQARWRRMRAERLVFFRSYLEDHEAVAVSNSRVREPADQFELLTLLKYDVQKFDTLLTADELELSERTFTFVTGCCNNTMNFDTQLRRMALPEWFVAPYDRTKQQIKWQRAAVTVKKAPQTMTSTECLKLANTWSRLQCPHVMKLFGACHIGRRRFFVVAEGTPLTRCFGDEGFPLWRAFHEAALALQYLHERRVGFDALSCADLILFRCGDRDAVMLAGFNLKQMRETFVVFDGMEKYEEALDPLLEDNLSDDGFDDVDTIRQEHNSSSKPTILQGESENTTSSYWQAPELKTSRSMGPTEASDIYALGVCVIEAFSGGNVWGNSGEREQNYRQVPTMRRLPRPSALADARQWDLVERMCSFDPKSRPTLAEVLVSFQTFAEDEDKANADFSSSKRRRKFRHHSSRQIHSRATSASIACALSEVQAWCDEASESSALNYQLYERMDDISARLEMMNTDDAIAHLPMLAELIFRFRDLLQRHVNENPLLRLAATRHVVKTIEELHGELDALMDHLQLIRSGASIHSWHLQLSSYREQLWKRLRLALTLDAQTLSGELDGEEELLLLGASLAFEAKKRSKSYTAKDLELLQISLVQVEETYQPMVPGPIPGFRTTESKTILALPSWFIPPYEVLFNELDDFSRGSFGSVHFGKWMDTNVLIKKMLAPEGSRVVTPLYSRRCTKSNAKEPTDEPYEQFLNEISVWSKLKHPNVLKLLGACHVGQRQFILREQATEGTIDSFVSSKSVEERSARARRKLHEAALGLHYLHAQNVVHADLRCSNILVDADGVVKLADFGFNSLKTTTQSNDSISDRSRWVAPECLRGETPTFASNVYSFAMCAIEVVSGDVPWGCKMADADVLTKIREGFLPPRPANCFSDAEWSLIERMCCIDPSERISIDEVVKLLA
ncbi:Serine/threonine-protein kinase STY13 [Phytophthora citrophthora]|uniref:Serine/threonine-protein kinase STY13 n=1 Tax=Phytophthora citrophthora TaxID=4793 RepID=A0AAD9FYH6_9STRA|nr:Serine/threonine-protein kinase STY13 [Phytophthora citrophthora]